MYAFVILEFPAGILQGAFFSSDRPRYMNYGAIGFVIGHEITHGFDDQGRQFDKEGNLVDWWAEETKKRYLEKAMCIINQYGNYTAEEVGLKVRCNKLFHEKQHLTRISLKVADYQLSTSLKRETNCLKC